MTLWASRDLPILEAFAAAEGRDSVRTGEIAEAVGCSILEVWVGLETLREAGYLTWSQQTTAPQAGERLLIVPRIAERGRRQLGQWPSDTYSAMISELDARIEASVDVDERGRLERFP